MRFQKDVMSYCNPTGLWSGIMFQDTPKFCRGIPDEVFISHKDKDILRGLAEHVKRISLRESEKYKRELWYKHNALETYQPVVLCDPENGWNEIITEDMIKCKGYLAQRWEVGLRKEIAWGEKIMDDRPIEPCFYVGYSYSESEWGVDLSYTGGKNGGAYTWNKPIKTIDDVNKLHYPDIAVDYKTTLETYELASDVFSGLLEVHLRGNWWWSFGFTFDLIRFIGLTEMMMYMYDNPELLHRLMAFLRDGFIRRLEFLEGNGLLDLNNNDNYVGSGGIGYCRELPKRNLENDVVRSIDMWGHSESQETVCVSPQMFEEFVFQYQLPVMKRFGLNCYGCCEPLDKRWHIIKDAPNLRRVSVSAWAAREKMCKYLEDQFIYSLKPNPAFIALPHIDETQVRKYVAETLDITKGCILEIIMKDNHTIGKNPQNVADWVKIVREEIDKIY